MRSARLCLLTVLAAAACAPEPDLGVEVQGAAADCPARLAGDTVPGSISSDGRNLELGTRFTTPVDALIVGARFPKAPGSPGPHTFHLWSSTGQLLRTEVLAAETSDGWQAVTFSQPYMSRTGDVFIISVQLPMGVFRYNGVIGGTPGAPVQPVRNGSFRSGVYGTGGTYPTIDVGFEYAVDVSVGDPYAPNAVTDLRQTAVSPSAATIAWTGSRDVSGANAQAATRYFVYRDGTRIATLAGSTTGYEDATLAPSTTYRFAVRAEDFCGNLSGETTLDVTTQGANPPPAGATIFGEGAAGTHQTSTDPAAVEVGVKLQASAGGVINGVRFWRDVGSTAGYTINLWNVTGTRLATANGAGGAVPGWQEIAFATPVPVQAGITYVASYFAPNGQFPYTQNGLGQAVTSGPLTALSSPSSGGNGVYAYSYGQGSRFPGASFQNSNYWVDVRYATGTTPPPPTPAQTIYGDAAPAGFGTSNGAYAIGVRFQAAVAGEIRAVRFYRPAAFGGTLTRVYLWSAGGGLLGQGARDTGSTVGWDEIALDAAVPIAASTTYVASYNVGPFPYRPRGLAAERRNGDLVALAGGGVFAEARFEDPVFPSRSYDGYEYFVDVRFGPASAPPPAEMQSVLGTAPPVNYAHIRSGSPVEVGTKIRTAAGGFVHAIRFWGDVPAAAGRRVNLYALDGTLLATAVSTSASSAGWAEIAFASPVAVTAGQTYVAAYFSPDGSFAYRGSGLRDAPIVRGDLTALQDGTSGPNGVYRYTPSSAFPTQGFYGALYLVDFRFSR